MNGSLAVDVFNEIVKNYETYISQCKPLSILLGKELYYDLVLISIAVALLNHLLKRSVDLAEANIEFIKTVIYLSVFLAMIKNYDAWLPLLFTTFKGAGKYLAQENFVNNPGQIVDAGLQICAVVLSKVFQLTNLTHIGLALISIPIALTTLVCFALIAIDLVVIDIGGRIILIAGIFMLGFSASPWTRAYAERYISATFTIGIKMMFLYIMVGVGYSNAQSWAGMLTNSDNGHFIAKMLAVGVASLIYFLLCRKVPDMATSLLAGQHSLGLGKGDITSAVMKGAGIVAGGMAGGKFLGDRAKTYMNNKAGKTQAESAANELGQMKAETEGLRGPLAAIYTDVFAGKTLKSVKSDMKKEERDLAIFKTQGGQAATRIQTQIKEEKQQQQNTPKDKKS